MRNQAHERRIAKATTGRNPFSSRPASDAPENGARQLPVLPSTALPRLLLPRKRIHALLAALWQRDADPLPELAPPELAHKAGETP
ncbi:MAG: hypothetical protein HQL96_03415 [Magnetococcales bacterium]|nr:hypothetical protein [Magnetococcales bacterium]